MEILDTVISRLDNKLAVFGKNVANNEDYEKFNDLQEIIVLIRDYLTEYKNLKNKWKNYNAFEDSIQKLRKQNIEIPLNAEHFRHDDAFYHSLEKPLISYEQFLQILKLLESDHDKHLLCDLIIRDYGLRTFNIIAYDLDKKNNHVQYKSLWGNEKDEAVKKASKQFKDNYEKEIETNLLSETAPQEFIDSTNIDVNALTKTQFLELIHTLLKNQDKIRIGKTEFQNLLHKGGKLIYYGYSSEIQSILHIMDQKGLISLKSIQPKLNIIIHRTQKPVDMYSIANNISRKMQTVERNIPGIVRILSSYPE
jgi:hypothetical protein